MNARANLALVEGEDTPPPGIILKKLGAQHKQAMALLAQGLDRGTIAKICNYTPEYVTWLQRQPVCKEYLKEMSEVVGVRLEALFESSVDAIADTLVNGNGEEKLKAARLQMEATKRLGRHEQAHDIPEDDRLVRLAQRLVALQGQVRSGTTLDGTSTNITDAELTGENASV